MLLVKKIKSFLQNTSQLSCIYGDKNIFCPYIGALSGQKCAKIMPLGFHQLVTGGSRKVSDISKNAFGHC